MWALTARRRFSTLSVGFIGLGNMGAPMALNLARSKLFDLSVFDIQNKTAMNLLKMEGAKPAESLAHLANNSSCIISMLPAYEHVKSVYLQSNGILDNVKKPNILLIDCSTIGPVGSTELAEEVKKRGHRMVDAPVSGGVPAATAGTLTFMVGGESADFELAKKLLSKMGKKIVHCGGHSMGQAVKVCNNLILGVSMLGVSEGFRLAESLGVDVKVFAEIVNTSSGRCWSSDTYNPAPGVMENVPSARDYTNGFGAQLMLKDLGLAVKAAQAVNTPVKLSEKAAEMYKEVVDGGHGNLDFSCVYKYSK